MDFFQTIFRQMFRFVNSLGPNGWAVIAIMIVFLGTYCMKGYGSRDTY